MILTQISRNISASATENWMAEMVSLIVNPRMQAITTWALIQYKDVVLSV